MYCFSSEVGKLRKAGDLFTEDAAFTKCEIHRGSERSYKARQLQLLFTSTTALTELNFQGNEEMEESPSPPS